MNFFLKFGFKTLKKNLKKIPAGKIMLIAFGTEPISVFNLILVSLFLEIWVFLLNNNN